MRSVLRYICKSINTIIAIILTCMIVLVFTNVVLRYGFASGFRPSVELSRLGLVWVVMLGAVIVLQHDEHLAVTEFSEKLFPKLVPLLRRLCWLIIFVSVSMLFIGSYHQMSDNWADISQLTGLPSALFYLAGVISGGLMAIIACIRIINPDWLLDIDDEQASVTNDKEMEKKQ